MSGVGRLATVFGGGVLAGQLGQVAWLAAGSRAMPLAAFGTVLAAQTLYGLLLYTFDYGSALQGARLAAAGALDDDARAAIVWTRVRAALGVACVALLIGAAGGTSLLTAIAPFAIALPLAASMRYWEPFGLGDGRPWAAYLVLRGWGPALAALAAIGLSRQLPVFVPGIVECVGLVMVMFAFRLRPIADLTAASRARVGAFAATLSVGLPSVVWQLGLLSGPVMLAATRSPAAAGMLAIGVRIVTGVNQLCGIVATSLFPATASGGGRHVATRGAWTVVLVAGAAVSLFLLAPEWIVAFVAGPGADEAVTPAIVAVGASGAVGLLLTLTMSEIALRRERTLVVSLVVSTALALVLYGVAAATGDALVGAGALVVGQLTGAALVARRVGGLRGPASAAFALAGATALVAAFEPARLPLAVVVLALVAVTVLRRVLPVGPAAQVRSEWTPERAARPRRSPATSQSAQAQGSRS